jgi:hypothetical protein
MAYDVEPEHSAGALSIERVARRESRGIPPWTSAELSRVVLSNALGLVLIGISWYQVAGQLTTRDQLAWLNVGILGIAVAGVSNALWLLRGRRNVGLARVLVLPDVPRRSASAWTERLAEDLENQPVANAAMTRYHRPSCPLVEGKQTTAASRRDHERAGKVPCELCEP